MVVLALTRDVPSALLAIGGLLLLDVINATILHARSRTISGGAMGFLQVSSLAAAIAGAFLSPIVAGLFGVASALIVSAPGAAVLALAAGSFWADGCARATGGRGPSDRPAAPLGLR